MRPVVVATAHCLLRPRRTLLGCGSKRFARRQSGATRSACGLRRRRGTIPASGRWGSVIGPAGRWEDSRAWRLDLKVDVGVRQQGWTISIASRNADQDSLIAVVSAVCTYRTRQELCYRGHSRAESATRQHQGKAASRAANMAARTATPAETLAAPARGFLDTCETFADEASSSLVSTPRPSTALEQKRGAPRAVGVRRRAPGGERAGGRSGEDRPRPRGTRPARLETRSRRLRRAVSNEPADMRREHSAL